MYCIGQTKILFGLPTANTADARYMSHEVDTRMP